MLDSISLAILLILIGLGVGALGTMIGLGGGFLLVPIFLIVFNFDHQIAVGTSLIVIFFNALSGTLAYSRQRRIDYYIGIRFAAAAVPGAFVGVAISQFLTSTAFNLSFAILLAVMAVLMFRGIKFKPKVDQSQLRVAEYIDEHGHVHKYSTDVRKGIVLSFFVGMLSSIFGIGGGVIHLPFMVLILGIPLHLATATSHFVLAITTLAGGGTFALYAGSVNWFFATFLAVGVIFGAQAGAWLSTKVKSIWISRLLAGAMLLVAIRLILGALNLM